MLEMKITVNAPELASAINSLAAALSDKAPHFVCTQNGGNSHQIETVGTLTMNMGSKAQPATPTAPVNPTPAPVAAPTQAPGAPLSATPAQTVAPAANVPVAPVAQAPVAQAPVMPRQPIAPAVPTGAPTYTLEMLATAGAALIDAGKMDALLNLLGKYGVAALTALDPAQYGSVASDLRALGAQI